MDDDFTFGPKKSLKDFDPTKIKNNDMWEDFVLSIFAHALFLGGLLIVAFMWVFAGRKDG